MMDTLLTVWIAIASWYGPGYEGKTTASGEVFSPDSLTFAHRTLPFGTVVEFSYKGRKVVARCNDRGPYVEDGSSTFRRR